MTVRRVSIRVGFANNPFAIQVGLAAAEYGQLPSTVLEIRDGDMPDIDRFKYNLDIFSATQSYKKQEQEKQEQRQGGTGVATEQEREHLVQEQVARAERREQREKAGQPDASVSKQAELLEKKRKERQEAEQIVDQEMS